ncbi:hypothetical protein VIC_000867 [Vibrio coralliilyticus ATCC BAA-450]|nr:hypothetical protein VIC_000867 [Vibrio coralliilyticus ATCC BAA-450]
MPLLPEVQLAAEALFDKHIPTAVFIEEVALSISLAWARMV